MKVARPSERNKAMITLEQAKALKRGDILYSQNYRNADGTAVRWRVMGLVKTWKRSPGRVRIPVKNGLYNYGSVDECNLGNLCLEDPTEAV